MSEPNTKTGIYENSNGGTEIMHRGLTERLGPQYLEKFQIICSRVRDIERGKKRILWLHDVWNDPENNHLSNPLSMQRFEKLVFVSNVQFHQYATAYGIKYSDSVIIPNAINPFKAVTKPDGPVRLIYHTTPHRGLELLVPTFEYLSKQYGPGSIHLDVFSSFNIYGWPQRDAPYEKLFDICRNHPDITYHGYQPNEVVREALGRAHIFAFPSIWPETSCIAAIEAAAAGCLVVSPDYAALSETLAGTPFTYRFDEDHQVHMRRFAEMLHKAIENVRTDGVLKYSSEQAERFNLNYGWDNRLKQWGNLLGSL